MWSVYGEVSVDSKLDSKNQLGLLPELADLHNCNNTLYFEARRHEDLYLWAAKTPNGPSIKMHVQNVHTMDELKMTGNCLKGSRGLLSFDQGFDDSEWGKLTKEVFTHVSFYYCCHAISLLTVDVILLFLADFRCTSSSSQVEALYWPYPDFLHRWLKDLVP